MTAVLLVGAGTVGAWAGRQLIDTPGLTRLLVTDREPARAASLASALGPGAEAVPFADPPFAEVAAVASTVPAAASLALVDAAVRAGVSIAAIGDEDDTLTALLDTDAAARAAGVAVVAGCALVPGLGEVLARHAANALDSTDEVIAVRVGTAGPACVEALRRVRRNGAREWVDGEWRSEKLLGRQLIWFPEPVGGRECEAAAAGVVLVRDAVPDLRHASVSVGKPPPRNKLMERLVKIANTPWRDNGWGAARVEVWGWRGQARESIVYCVVDQPAVAAGTVLAVTAARLAGLLPSIELLRDPVGASGLGTLVEPTSFLAELARRGVKAATFEGVNASTAGTTTVPETMPDSGNGTRRRLTAEQQRLALLLVPIFAILVAGWTSVALAPTLLVEAPALLLVLGSARNQMYVLTAPLLDFTPFFIIGILRMLIVDPLFFVLGRRYGTRGLRWIESRSGSPRFINRVERWYRAASYPILSVTPNYIVLTLAGATGMPAIRFFLTDLAGTLTRMGLIWGLGEVFSEDLLNVVDFIGRYAVWFTAATVALVAFMFWRGRKRGTPLVESLDEAVERSKGSTTVVREAKTTLYR